MNGLFPQLEDEGYFREYVTAHFQKAPAAVIADFPCEHAIDANRVGIAHGDYSQTIREYSVLLHSANPDHYKRSGALLRALYQSKIIVGVDFRASTWGSIEQVEIGRGSRPQFP